eukprot:TRINITY_DN11505_c0_g1_i3.p1 TRINITY_DN11505_c0_g1~~TRINITY_DN11505_c0_g1_i3.p1  ORF type:complete len:645 (+),score=116.23 TRINITY_DN11505_c0_g1_i3:1503-3437(+)
MRLIFDVETNGFLEVVSTLHALCIKNLDTGTLYSCCDYYHVYVSPHPEAHVMSLADGIELLNLADELIGHNIIKYDLPVLLKLRKDFSYRGKKIHDTLIYARLIWPRDHLRERDFALNKQGRLPGNLIGSHSLEAFGYRSGVMKGDYSDWCKEQGLDPWSCWRPEMQSYCEQDVAVTEDLYHRIINKQYAPAACEIEHITAFVIAQMERNGFPFDEPAAAQLYAQVVQERDDLEAQLKVAFKPWYASEGVVTPKKTIKYKARPWVIEGAQYTKISQIEFNPSSRDHIADRLTKLYGWKPEAFTDNGKPIVDETTLSNLNYPEAKLLTRYLLLQKRAGQISEGREGWLKVSRNGVIHGSVNTVGAVTRRATHMSPNIAQVPRVGSYFGAECRALFYAGPGYVQVGCDLSGIELRMLAHYMSRWDGGAYARAVCEGKSEDETDVHSLNCKALGLEPKKLYVVNGKSIKGRDIAKTFIYAFLYGAGPAKLASILGIPEKDGAKLKARFLRSLPALKKLIDSVQEKAKSQGFLIGLDGGRLQVRSAHSALNTLLQSAGAIVAKYWLAEAAEAYERRGWKTADQYPVGDEDYLLRAWVHDETQASVLAEIAEEYGRETVAAIEAAGRRLKLRVPITGEYKIGKTWADCH